MKIKSNEEAVAKFLGAAVWADGVFDEAEKVACEEIADALEINAIKFSALVDKTHRELDKLDEDKLNEYLVDAAVDIDEDDVEYVFECALQLVLSDGILMKEEVENLMSIADALGIEDSHAILMLCDMIKEEPDMTVEF